MFATPSSTRIRRAGADVDESLRRRVRAAGLLAGADVDESLRRRVRARLANLELLDRLENVRLEKLTARKDNHFDGEGADGLYGQTFREAGLDVEALSAEEAAERVRQSTEVVELAAVLDQWALIRRRIRGADDPGGKALLRVARLADPDAWRTRVREALERSDGQALLALASSEEVFGLVPATLSVLGFALLDDEGSRRQAEAFLREAQRQHPNDFWLNYNLWHFFSELQPPQWEEAYPFAAVGVALRPGSPNAHNNLGLALQYKGLVDEAIAQFKKAIRVNTDDHYAHNNLGVLLCDQKRDYDGAIAVLREAIRLKKDCPEAHNNLGNALQYKGLVDEAIDEYREAIRLKKDYADAHGGLGNALQYKGLVDEAIDEYREAIRLKKDYALAHYNLGVTLRGKGLLDEAIAAYREAIRIKKDDPASHNNLGSALHDKDRMDEAIAEYREAIRLKKNYAEAHYNLGVTLRGKGLLDEAIAEFKEAIRLNKDYAEAHNNLGTALYGKGLLDEAIAEFKEAIRLNKDDAEVHCNLGLALKQKGQFLQSVEALRRGHELGSKNPRWPYPSAQWLQEAERLAQLDDRLAAVLEDKDQPKDAAERLAFAKICQLDNRKRYAAAVRFFGEAFAADSKLAGDQPSDHRYNAACAAVLAGCGQGTDADKLDAKERTRLRQQALDWLRADLKAWRQVLDKSPDKAGPATAQQMQHWLQDADFAGVRGPNTLTRLPEAERQEWRKLWEEVEALRQRAAGRPAVASPARP
jgi:tetratricopeptide (TPR) repeat protein